MSVGRNRHGFSGAAGHPPAGASHQEKFFFKLLWLATRKVASIPGIPAKRIDSFHAKWQHGPKVSLLVNPALEIGKAP